MFQSKYSVATNITSVLFHQHWACWFFLSLRTETTYLVLIQLKHTNSKCNLDFWPILKVLNSKPLNTICSTPFFHSSLMQNWLMFTMRERENCRGISKSYFYWGSSEVCQLFNVLPFLPDESSYCWSGDEEIDHFLLSRLKHTHSQPLLLVVKSRLFI